MIRNRLDRLADRLRTTTTEHSADLDRRISQLLAEYERSEGAEAVARIITELSPDNQHYTDTKGTKHV